MRIGFVIWIVLLLISHSACGPETLAGFAAVLFLGVGGVCLFVVARKAWRAMQS